MYVNLRAVNLAETSRLSMQIFFCSGERYRTMMVLLFRICSKDHFTHCLVHSHVQAIQLNRFVVVNSSRRCFSCVCLFCACWFVLPLPLGVIDRLQFVIVALHGLFFYIFSNTLFTLNIWTNQRFVKVHVYHRQHCCPFCH